MCFNHKNSRFNLKKNNKCTISLCLLCSGAGTGALYFLRLRLSIFFVTLQLLVLFKRLRPQIVQKHAAPYGLGSGSSARFEDLFAGQLSIVINILFSCSFRYKYFSILSKTPLDFGTEISWHNRLLM